MIFFFPCGSKPRENSCYGVRKHRARSGQVGVRVTAQINICLTPQSRYYLTGISEWEVVDPSPFHVFLLFFFSVFFFFTPFPISCREQPLPDWRLSARLVVGQNA